jgi:hypothetical protein
LWEVSIVEKLLDQPGTIEILSNELTLHRIFCASQRS